MTGQPQVPVEVDEICRLYRAGMTCRQVAKRVGSSTTTVWRRLRQAQVRTRKRGARGTT